MAASLRVSRLMQFGNVLIKRRIVTLPTPNKNRFWPANRIQNIKACRYRHPLRLLSTQSAPVEDSDYHSIIKDTEKATGDGAKHEFQAETRMLLDIVAKSLYSEKEVFIRELISNASDALEKLRYLSLTDAGQLEEGAASRPLEIHIATDKQNMTLTIQDTGIGMTQEELISNLGTIARSGSKAFLEELKGKARAPEDVSSIIGQFGVGFYSSFMVAEKVEVFSKSSSPGTSGFKWTSDGTGTYEIQDAEGVQPGTKIVLFLKPEDREFSDEDKIKGVIKKYSNFVGSPIFVNGKRANVIQPLWTMEPKDITEDMHIEFYRFVGNSYDRPRFTLHYKIDAPVNVRALLYVPEGKPGLFEIAREGDYGVALYSRKILIKSRVDNIFPKWLRFLKGVVDSEDIPLNLSRELLQNSSLIRKFQAVLTNRVIRFLYDKSTKEPAEYEKFYKDYGLFIGEGIVTTNEQAQKEEIAKLLMYESSQFPEGEKISIPKYMSRLKEGQKDIFYLCAPSRALAEASPYFEAMKRKDVEVLFCYEPWDEAVLMQLRQFDSRNLTSVEKEMRQEKESEDLTDLGPDSLQRSEIESLLSWVRKTLANKAYSVRITKRLDSHPCVVTVEEMAAVRHLLKTQAHLLNKDNRFAMIQPQLEINPRHPVIKKLSTLTSSNPKLAELLINQLFSNAMVSAGLVEDPRTLLSSMNELLTLALEKH